MVKPALYIAQTFCSCVFGLNAQLNLICIGNFEEYYSCPVTESVPFQNPKEIEKCTGCKAPNYGTRDYLNTCACNYAISVPLNPLREQMSFKANGYLGGYFSNHKRGACDDGYSDIMRREYVQGQMIQLLEQGKIYRLSKEVSLAEYSDLMITEITNIFAPNGDHINDFWFAPISDLAARKRPERLYI